MTRTYLSLSLVSLFTLALAGCANNTNNTQNPDTTGGQTSDVGTGGDSGGGEASQGESRARKSTAPRGAGRNTKARKVTTSKPPRVPGGGGGGGGGGEDVGPNGLIAEAFSLESAEALPDFANLGSVAESFPVPNLDFDEIAAGDGFPGLNSLQANYALRFSGSINIVEEAEYELCLHSDDGSQLLLEDMLVVDNDGVHDEPVEACELVYLAPGEYRLEIRYFQADGPLLAMHFAWAINGGDKVIVPTEVLFKPATTAR